MNLEASSEFCLLQSLSKKERDQPPVRGEQRMERLREGRSTEPTGSWMEGLQGQWAGESSCGQTAWVLARVHRKLSSG